MEKIMELQKAIADVSHSPSIILAKAVVRAGDNLVISNAILAKVLGLSPATITRMRRGEYTLDGKAFELAALFVRVYRSLDAIVGGDDAVAAKWMQAENVAVNDKPINLIQKVAGLVNVLQYLDSRRAIS
jgi:uncharacterized protein (DUF2384 family)